MPKRSGRYPFGSGEHPYQDYPEMRKQTKQLIKSHKSEYKAEKKAAKKELKAATYNKHAKTSLGSAGISAVLGGVFAAASGPAYSIVGSAFLSGVVSNSASDISYMRKLNKSAKKIAAKKITDKYKKELEPTKQKIDVKINDKLGKQKVDSTPKAKKKSIYNENPKHEGKVTEEDYRKVHNDPQFKKFFEQEMTKYAKASYEEFQPNHDTSLDDWIKGYKYDDLGQSYYDDVVYNYKNRKK